jgi:molecular chaperone GrpE
MNKNEAFDNDQQASTDLNEAFAINTDENVNGSQHLNEPVAEESEVEELKSKNTGAE